MYLRVVCAYLYLLLAYVALVKLRGYGHILIGVKVFPPNDPISVPSTVIIYTSLPYLSLSICSHKVISSCKIATFFWATKNSKAAG